MARIRIRGHKEDIYIPDVIGRQLKADFDSGTLPDVIKIGADSSIARADLRGVFLEGEEKKKQQQDFSEMDLQQFKRNLARFKQKEINGKLQSRFTQYMHEVGVAGITESGEMVIRDPMGYHKASKILAEIEDREAKKEYAQRKTAEEYERLGA